MTREVSLLVNDAPIPLDYFVQGFIDHTIGGMLEVLEGTGKIENLDLSVDGDAVAINLNKADIPANPFVSQVIGATIRGMVSSLKGVGEINSIKISIRR